MPGSCSSNTLNGCANCAPIIFHLFYFEVSTSQAMAGHLYESVYYKNFNRKLTSGLYTNGLNVEYDCTGDPIVIRGSGSISQSSIYNYEVDEFGNIAIYVTGTSNSSLTGSQQNTPEENPYYLNGTTNTVTFSTKNKCDSDATETTQDCTKSDNIGYQGECVGVADCTGPSAEGDCGRYYRCKDDSKYTSPIDLEFIHGLCESSVGTKIGILTNNRSQNCNGSKCGSGNKDDCWGFYTADYFFLNDNNLDDPNANSTNFQKLKFKMATIKEGFDKTYKSVSGKLKFYYGGTGGKTPCCNDDFDGTVLKEAGYSISAGSTFKNDYLASDAGDIDNSDQSAVGEAIYICSTVDSVSFIDSST